MGSTHVFGAKGQTLSASSNVMAAGNYPGATLSVVDPDLAAANVVSGVQIFGVTGTATIGALPNTGQTAVYQTGDNGSWVSSAGSNVGGHQEVFYNLVGATLVASPVTTGSAAILDLRTQLMWVTNFGAIGGQPMTWSSAISAANAFSLGQYGPGTWRMPNVKELQSIQNYNNTGICGVDWQFSNVIVANGQYYWTSTTTPGVGGDSYSYGIDLYLGITRLLDKSGSWYVCLVRGGPL